MQKQITSFILHCKSKQLDKKTLKSYELDLCAFAEFSSGKTSVNALKDYINYLDCMYKARTAQRKIMSLKVFFSYLCDIDFIVKNPFNKIKTPYKQPPIATDTLTPSSVEKIIEQAYDELDRAKTQKQKATACRDIAVLEVNRDYFTDKNYFFINKHNDRLPEQSHDEVITIEPMTHRN